LTIETSTSLLATAIITVDMAAASKPAINAMERGLVFFFTLQIYSLLP
jgi:hypothetical protein